MIVFFGFNVNVEISIKFDGEFTFLTIKIGSVATYRMLSSELFSFQLPVTK